MASATSSVVAPGTSRSSDRKSTRLNSSHTIISYAVFCLKKKKRRLDRPDGRAPRRGQADRVDGAQRGARAGRHQVFFFLKDARPPDISPLPLRAPLRI